MKNNNPLDKDLDPDELQAVQQIGENYRVENSENRPCNYNNR